MTGQHIKKHQLNVKLYASGIRTEKAGNMHVYDWETKMALQETTRTTLQCKKRTWYGRQMKYILMNNNA